ncbi:MAG: esterase [Burkholderiaceae bacterium]|nr:esterase [Burkholderiaceae bacterium]
MTTVIYLHGFRSTPQAMKGSLLREAWSDKARFLAPDLNVSPAKVQTLLRETVKDIDPKSLVVVGASLGGFYAHWLAETVGCRAVLLNPATQPWGFIHHYLGEQTIYGTDRTMTVTEDFAIELKAMQAEIADASRYWVLLCTGDEVLDWKVAHRQYADCRQIVIDGNNHMIEGFEAWIPELEKFVFQAL